MKKDTIYIRFSHLAAHRPDATAVAEDGWTVTYRELDAMADAIMSKFYDDRYATVGIVMSHGIEMAGVSLSGLFALWQWLMNDTFRNIISLSGSFWYAGFELDDAHLLQLRSLFKVSSTLARVSYEAASMPAATRSAARRVLSRASSATSRII